MKATYIQPGDTLDYTNPTESTIEAGTVIVFGSKAAIAAADIPPMRMSFFLFFIFCLLKIFPQGQV